MFKERQLESPDRGDAFCGCASEKDTSLDVTGHNDYINLDDFQTEVSSFGNKLAHRAGL